MTFNGHGLSETARNLGINANMLSRWKREDEAKQNGALSGNDLSVEERDELRQLRSEVKRLRMEREIFRPRSWHRPLYAFRGGLRGAGASSTESKIAANMERGGPGRINVALYNF